MMNDTPELSQSTEIDRTPPRFTTYPYPDEGLNWSTDIFHDIIDNPDDLRSVRDQLELPFEPSISRHMARVIIHENLLRQKPLSLYALGPEIEGIIPLGETGKSALEGCYQFIFARNSSERQTSPEIIEQELQAVTEAFKKGQTIFKEVGITAQSIPDDVEIQILNELSPDITRKTFINLVTGAFAEDEEAILENLENRAVINIAAVSKITGETLCAASATRDRDTLYRKGKRISLNAYDIGHAKVHPDHANRKLYTATLDRLYRTLAQKKGFDKVDFISGYSNTQRLEVPYLAGKMGRSIVTDVAAELELPIKPAIQQTITDGKWVDEIITFMPGNRLRSLYGV